MLSNQLLHKAVQDMKRISGLECAVWDKKGVCLVMTSEKMPAWEEKAVSFGESGEEERVEEEICLFLIRDEEDPVYILGMEGYLQPQ